MRSRWMKWTLPGLLLAIAAIVVTGSSAGPDRGPAAQGGRVMTGQGALGDWTTDAPGVRRRITVADLPPPYATESADNRPSEVKRPANAWPKVPAGFRVEEFLSGLDNPRVIRTASGDDIWEYEGQLRPNVGLNAVAGRPPEEYGFEPTSFKQMRKGCYDIHERIRDMNVNGVLGSLCFPSMTGFCGQLFSRTPDLTC
jgi:hypothetical protein